MTHRSNINEEDKIGSWSEAKLELLEKYLIAYATIMHNQKQTWLTSFHYVDAFAGTGIHKAKDGGRLIEGSPLRALKVEPAFDVYWFIEVSSLRIERLEQLKLEFPDKDIRIRQGDCNEVLLRELVPQITRESKQRALAFVDPYGLEVEWNTIVQLAEAETFDVFINFSMMGVTRLLEREKLPSKDTLNLLNRLMGHTEWVDQIYQSPPQMSLFGEQVIVRGKLRTQWLASLYKDYLSCRFPQVSTPVIMKNTKGSPLYALFLGSHNKTAVKITNDIFRRFERLKEVDSKKG